MVWAPIFTVIDLGSLTYWFYLTNQNGYPGLGLVSGCIKVVPRDPGTCLPMRKSRPKFAVNAASHRGILKMWPKLVSHTY